MPRRLPPPSGRSAAPLVFRGCIDNAPDVLHALELAVAGVFGPEQRPRNARELWHFGLGWCPAATDARAASAHAFAELYDVPESELACGASGLSLEPQRDAEHWRGYIALSDDDAAEDVAAGDLVLWRSTAPFFLETLFNAGGIRRLPVDMKPRASLAPLALARLQLARNQQRCTRFASNGGVELLRATPRVHGVGGARRMRQLKPFLMHVAAQR